MILTPRPYPQVVGCHKKMTLKVLRTAEPSGMLAVMMLSDFPRQPKVLGGEYEV
jgi:hypothetical protein